MLTRYAEVVAALRDPQLTISAGGHLDEVSHRELRESARALTLPRAAERWAARFRELPPQCDLIVDVARLIEPGRDVDLHQSAFDDPTGILGTHARGAYTKMVTGS
jgi:hypothetical protein